MKYKKQIIIAVSIVLFMIVLTTNSMANIAIVDTDTLKLRKEASTDSEVLDLLNKGEELEVIEEKETWVKIKIDGITGYVHKDYVEIQKDEKTNNEPQSIETNTAPTDVLEEKQPIREETLKGDTDVYILPLINSNRIANIKEDTKITVIDEVKGWLYIQTNEINGWIINNFTSGTVTTSSTNVSVYNQEEKQNQETEITQEEPQEQEEETKKTQENIIEEKTMYVNSSSIYVRKGPSTETEILDSLILNSQVIVTAEVDDWYKVKVSGIEGYIAKRLLSNSKTETTSRSAEERISEQNTQIEETTTQTSNISKGQEIVNYAKQYLGCKYVYGGSGPSTFDCSGFTMYVFKNFGISLSHSARAQSKNGTYVAKEDLQLGDLVFFKDYETMDGIGHCGIYIGEGNFIHASSGIGYCVKVSTLLSGSYYNRYETARRLI